MRDVVCKKHNIQEYNSKIYKTSVICHFLKIYLVNLSKQQLAILSHHEFKRTYKKYSKSELHKPD